jgi:hypothetical protein
LAGSCAGRDRGGAAGILFVLLFYQRRQEEAVQNPCAGERLQCGGGAYNVLVLLLIVLKKHFS